MKTLLLFATLVLFLPESMKLQAQTGPQAKADVKTAADLKTGNSQDVLASFFQLAFDNLTGKNKSFKFQSSLFAIKAKTDDNLWIDRNYLKEKFSRNFVITVSPQLDSNFEFTGNLLGAKYAIVNNRDKTVFDFTLRNEKERVQIKNDALTEYLNTIPGKDITNPNFTLASNFFVDKNDPDGQTAIRDLPDAFIGILKKHLSGSNSFKDMDLEVFQGYLLNEYEKAVAYVENRALWTIEANAISNTDGKLFSSVSINSEYLKGMVKDNSKMNVELNLQAGFNFNDDTSSRLSTDLNRQIFSFEGGVNWIIAKNRNRKSIIELKATISYNNIIKGHYPGEDKSRFLGEGIFRVRVTNDIWIPVEIKYDPGNGNVFGLLSIKSNFDWLK